MSANTTLYGLDHQDQLTADSPEEALEEALDNACEQAEEPFDAVAGRVKWPVLVYSFKRMSVDRYAPKLAEQALEFALETLDEEHADPDGDSPEPTEAMKVAATAFAEVITREYKSWACEKTGEVTEFTREQAKAVWDSMWG